MYLKQKVRRQSNGWTEYRSADMKLNSTEIAFLGLARGDLKARLDLK
jgi:hypothetical protein